jgi:acyl carrier protein
MVPSEIVVLDALPRALSGKVDRATLSTTAIEPHETTLRQVSARTPLEEALAAIWCDVLDTDHVGLQDNFFDIGGHSMRLVRTGTLIKQRLGLSVTMVTLLSYPTVQSLAAQLTEQAAAANIPAAVGQ